MEEKRIKKRRGKEFQIGKVGIVLIVMKNSNEYSNQTKIIKILRIIR